MFLFCLKPAIGLKTCFGSAFDKLLVFVDQKYHTWDSFVAKTQKGDYKDQNPNFRFLFFLKQAIGLKTCFGSAFDKLSVFVDQNYHTFDSFDAKTQNGDYKDQKPNLRSFLPKTSNWAWNLFWWCIWQTFGVCRPKVPHLRYIWR